MQRHTTSINQYISNCSHTYPLYRCKLYAYISIYIHLYVKMHKNTHKSIHYIKYQAISTQIHDYVLVYIQFTNLGNIITREQRYQETLPHHRNFKTSLISKSKNHQYYGTKVPITWRKSVLRIIVFGEH